jgi:hypothetical protein
LVLDARLTNKGLLGRACLFIIAHFGRQLLWTPDVPLAQPTPQKQLHLFSSFLPDLFSNELPRIVTALKGSTTLRTANQRVSLGVIGFTCGPWVC